MRTFLSKLRALVRRRDLEAEMAEEMRQHLERRTQEKIADGLSAEDARYAAQREFGGVTQVQEQCRDERRFVWLEQIFRDVRFAGRSLRKNPGFTFVVVLTLGLGVGANTALFSVINSVVLRPLPFPDAGRLVWLAERWPGVDRASLSYPNFLDWREQQSVFDRMGAYRSRSYSLTGDAEPVQTMVGEISVEVLSALGVQPALGRLFTPDEDSAGGAAVALLSDTLWRNRYGASVDIVGQAITLSGQRHTVIGVMPRSFDFPRDASLWIPIAPVVAKQNLTSRAAHSGHFAVARLKPGVTLDQARTNLDAIAAQLDAQYPEVNRGHRVLLTSLHAALIDGAGKTLWPLFGAAGLVLLIACANVANLLLARASARQKEMAVRAALGASRGQILRQMFIESVVLAALGGAVGLLLAQAALQGIISVMSAALPTVTDTRLDGTVMIFCAAAAMVSSILFGLAPAWQASGVQLQSGLQSATRGTSGRCGSLRLGLIVTEFALTLVLLIGAGLLLRTLVRLENVDPGYATDRVLTFRVDLNVGQYPAPPQRSAFFDELLHRLRSLPGVAAASMVSHVPLSGSPTTMEFGIDGQEDPPPGSRPFTNYVLIDRDYFRTMNIPVLRGRAFDAQDGTSGVPTVIIDEEFARRYWPDRDPIGERIRIGSAEAAQPVATIVGVVGRVKQASLSEQGGNVQAYRPFAAGTRPGMTIVIRTIGDPTTLAASARQQVLALDPHQPIHSLRTLEEFRERSGSSQRLNLILLGTFAMLALGLAAIGLYGVLSYLVSQRQREIGVRLALGARRTDIVKMILREGLTFMSLGAAIGLVAAVALARVLSHVLFEISPYDPATFGTVLVVLGLVGLFACWLPARRAANVDPMLALRSE